VCIKRVSLKLSFASASLLSISTPPGAPHPPTPAAPRPRQLFMTPLGQCLGECFLCTDGARRGSTHVPRSTFYAHRYPDKRRRLGSPDWGGKQADDRVGQSVRARAGAGVAEGASAGARAEAAVGAFTDAEAIVGAGMAAGVGVAAGTSARAGASAGRRIGPAGDGR